MALAVEVGPPSVPRSDTAPPVQLTACRLKSEPSLSPTAVPASATPWAQLFGRLSEGRTATATLLAPGALDARSFGEVAFGAVALEHAVSATQTTTVGQRTDIARCTQPLLVDCTPRVRSVDAALLHGRSPTPAFYAGPRLGRQPGGAILTPRRSGAARGYLPFEGSYKATA